MSHEKPNRIAQGWAFFRKLQQLKFLIPISLLAVSAFLLFQAKSEFSQDDVSTAILHIPTNYILFAVLASLGSFLTLCGVELLGFRYANAPILPSRVLKVSFVAFSVSNIFSFAGIAGIAVRFRMYQRNQVDRNTLFKVAAFSSLSVWLGLFALLSLNIFLQPREFPHIPYVSFDQVNLIGYLGIGLLLTYFILSYTQTSILKIKGESYRTPELGIVFLQILLSAWDWVLSAMVLYFLLPQATPIHFAKFLYIFLLGQVIGTASSLPGGIGVLDALVVYGLTADAKLSAALAGSLVLFRLIYYVVPAIAGALLFAFEEILESSKQYAVLFRGLLRFSVRGAPLALAAVTAGFSLYLFGTSSRVAREIANETSYWDSALLWRSFAAAMVLILADGLRRRSRMAWKAAQSLSFATMVVAVLLNSWLILFFAGLASLALFVNRAQFYVGTRVPLLYFSKEKVAQIFLILASVSWIGFASSLTPDVALHPWWSSLMNPSGSAIGWSVFPASLCAIFFVWKLLLQRADPEDAKIESHMSLVEAKKIADRSALTQSQLVLVGDKNIFASKDSDGFVMYGVNGSVWVSMGDPVSTESASAGLIKDFSNFVVQHGGSPAFYQVRPESLHRYVDLGFQFIKLGEEARVYIAEFNLNGPSKKSLRNAQSRIEREGYSFEIIPKERIEEALPQLRKISDEWMRSKGTREKGFSLGYYTDEYMRNFDVAVVKKNKEIVSFANIWTSGAREELSVDLMRSLQTAPPGCIEFIFTQLIFWGQKNNYRWFNLGMAPLSGLENEFAFAPSWNHVGNLIFQAGEKYYNFQGVRSFKQKFSPVWEPRYLAFPRNLEISVLATNLTRLIGRTPQQESA